MRGHAVVFVIFERQRHKWIICQRATDHLADASQLVAPRRRLPTRARVIQSVLCHCRRVLFSRGDTSVVAVELDAEWLVNLRRARGQHLKTTL